MNSHGNETELGRRAYAIGVWENEGGAPAPDTPGDQFGRRVEVDRSWTVYHVFTGVPARVDGTAMTDLSRPAATDGMLSLNLRNVRTQERAEHARRCSIARQGATLYSIPSSAAGRP